MHETTNHFLTATNNDLVYRYTLPKDVEPKAHIVMLHGWGDHGGRYSTVGETLREQGYAVYLPDFPGHGLSPGRRAQVHDFGRLVDDLHLFLQQAIMGSRIVLCGHSMGGCLAFHFAVRYPELLAGVIFNSAALTINPQISRLKRGVANVLGGLVPRLSVGNLKTVSMMTIDPDEQRAYLQDPLLHHGAIDAGTGKALMQANAWVGCNMHRLTVPFLALQGSDDSLVNPQGPELLIQRASAKDKEIEMYPGSRHDLLHERNKIQVMQRILQWLDQRFQAGVASAQKDIRA